MKRAYSKDGSIERHYFEVIMSEFNLNRESVYSIRHRWNMRTFQQCYNEIIYRERIKEKLKAIMAYTSPSVLLPMFNNKYRHSSAISFVKYLYRTRDKGIINDNSKIRIEQALRILDDRVEVSR